MGQLIEGKWMVEEVNPKTKDGEFRRQKTRFHNRISKGSEFPPEANRYHLYVSYACPWAHRAMLFRKLKGLEDFIDISVVGPHMGQDGWTFNKADESTGDLVNGCQLLREVYVLADPKVTGRVTVPILWDKKQNTIVNNESSEIIRIFNSDFNELTGNTLDFYPEALRSKIDKWNDEIYHSINNGVYKVGFARSQEAYETNVKKLFQSLDHLEEHLKDHKYLVDDQVTEADWRLFPTLLRFDAVYVGHFKCNIKRISDYPHLSKYLESLYNYPGVAETINMKHIKGHYYGSHETLNPSGIVPVGPELSWLK